MQPFLDAYHACKRRLTFAMHVQVVVADEEGTEGEEDEVQVEEGRDNDSAKSLSDGLLLAIQLESLNTRFGNEFQIRSSQVKLYRSAEPSRYTTVINCARRQEAAGLYRNGLFCSFCSQHRTWRNRLGGLDSILSSFRLGSNAIGKKPHAGGTD